MRPTKCNNPFKNVVVVTCHKDFKAIKLAFPLGAVAIRSKSLFLTCYKILFITIFDPGFNQHFGIWLIVIFELMGSQLSVGSTYVKNQI